MKFITEKVKIMVYMLVILLLISFGCQRDFLNIKPDKSLVVPESLADVQGLLDNSAAMNIANNGYFPILISDDYYMTDQLWNSLTDPALKKAYTWDKSVYEDDLNYNDWKRPYQQIFYANLALEQLSKLKLVNASDLSKKLSLHGAALFYRGTAFFHLVQLFAKPYRGVTAEIDLGIVLRLESDITVPSVRRTLAESYAQIIDDLTVAAEELPLETDMLMRPSKIACYSMLARVYLMMNKYELALDYADKVLEHKDDILDYRLLNVNDRFPLMIFNKEVIFHQSMLQSSNILVAPNQKASQELLNLYTEDDLRKQIFYTVNPDGSFSFKGSYVGTGTLFNGITTTEVLLIRAECLIRLKKTEQALVDLERLRRNRILSNWEVPSGVDMLILLIEERRRELAFRGIRWWDMRRLQDDPIFAKDYNRYVAGKTYQLTEGFKDFVLPIPALVINLSGIENN